MKRYAILPVFVLLALSCVTARFSDVENKDWELVTLRQAQDEIVFDRKTLIEEGFEDIFSLRFDRTDNRLNGIGAPNRFFGPYTATDKQGLSIKNVASTMMAAIREPEKLKEHEFFMYLQNTTRWNLVKGNLELYSKDAGGAEVVLTFAPSRKKK